MERKRYDLIFSLGQACSCTQTLRKAKLQPLSFPFDWLFYTQNDGRVTTVDLPRRVEHLCSDFKDWFNRDDLDLHSAPSDTSKLCIVRNRHTTALLPHDFHSLEEFDNGFDAVRQKYDRRIRRLLKIIRSAKRVLGIRLDGPFEQPPTPTEDCREARRRLAARYPGVTFDLIHFIYETGRTYENRIETEIEPGLLEVTFDYRDYTPGKAAHEVRLDQTGAVVKQYATLKDYRTTSEKVRRFFRKIFR